jgi:predicted naringenin-chalcone synthase
LSVLPRISRLSVTDHPEDPLSQHEVMALLGLEGDDFAERVFGRSAVTSRSLGLSTATLERTLQGRTSATEDQLFANAVQAVSELDLDPTKIGTIITASLYSLGGPTLAHRLVEAFGMDPATDKYHVIGVGCASMVPLVRLATPALAQHPDKKAVIVAAESMSGLLSRATPEDERSKTVGSAIFGDGCGAVAIDHGDSGPAIVASKVHQIPSTLDVVRMELSDVDSYLHLDRDLPDVAAAGLAELVDDFLDASGLVRADVNHWIVHPGGRRILDCAREALGLSVETLDVSYDVLSNRGNVGTPSIFYVLSETIRRRQPGSGERGLMITVGPGVTVGLMLLAF